jgi:hypothetical protein
VGDRIKCRRIYYESRRYSVRMVNRRLAIIVIIAAVSIGLLLQFMLLRIEDVGVDWIVVALGLAAVGILVIAALQYHQEICQIPGKKE